MVERKMTYTSISVMSFNRINKELTLGIMETAKSGPFHKGPHTFQNIPKIREYFVDDVRQWRSAAVLRSRFDPHLNKRSVRERGRNYPENSKSCLPSHILQLVHTSFIHSNLQVYQKAARHLLTEDAHEPFWTAVDAIPFNAATKAEKLDISGKEAERTALKGSARFALVGFFSAYWQYPLHPSSYDACGTIAPQETHVSRCLLHDVRKNAAYV